MFNTFFKRMKLWNKIDKQSCIHLNPHPKKKCIPVLKYSVAMRKIDPRVFFKYTHNELNKQPNDENVLLFYDIVLGCYITSPLNAGLPWVVEETTFLQKLADLRFQDTVELVSLPTFNHLMIVKVQHSHSVCMLWSFQVTLWAKTKTVFTQ